jgi:hypothetical protein
MYFKGNLINFNNEAPFVKYNFEAEEDEVGGACGTNRGEEERV